MEYKYMKKMAKTPTIGVTENAPISEEQIKSIEEQIGKTFPKAYREFLLLGGREANMIADMSPGLLSHDYQVKYWEQNQRYAARTMHEAGFDLKKDFWAFAILDTGEQFHFFYFDEGDDPPVYWYCSYHMNAQGNEYAGVVDLERTFSEHINRQIDYRKAYGY